jgi:hypothetical protein
VQRIFRPVFNATDISCDGSEFDRLVAVDSGEYPRRPIPAGGIERRPLPEGAGQTCVLTGAVAIFRRA